MMKNKGDVRDLDYHKTKSKMLKEFPIARGKPWFEDCFHDTYVHLIERPPRPDLNTFTLFFNTFRFKAQRFYYTRGKRGKVGKKNNTHLHTSIDELQEQMDSEQFVTATMHEILDKLSITDAEEFELGTTLTKWQMDVLQMMLVGIPNKEIAQHMNTTPANVDNARRKGVEKLRKEYMVHA